MISGPAGCRRDDAKEGGWVLRGAAVNKPSSLLSAGCTLMLDQNCPPTNARLITYDKSMFLLVNIDYTPTYNCSFLFLIWKKKTRSWRVIFSNIDINPNIGGGQWYFLKPTWHFFPTNLWTRCSPGCVLKERRHLLVTEGTDLFFLFKTCLMIVLKVQSVTFLKIYF